MDNRFGFTVTDRYNLSGNSDTDVLPRLEYYLRTNCKFQGKDVTAFGVAQLFNHARSDDDYLVHMLELYISDDPESLMDNYAKYASGHGFHNLCDVIDPLSKEHGVRYVDSPEGVVPVDTVIESLEQFLLEQYDIDRKDGFRVLDAPIDPMDGCVMPETDVEEREQLDFVCDDYDDQQGLDR